MKRLAKPEVQAAYNASVMFVDLHFYQTGAPKSAPVEVAAKWQNKTIQQALVIVLQSMEHAISLYGNEQLRDNAERQVMAALVSFYGHACSFAKWSSTWSNFVLPKLKAPNGVGVIFSPGFFGDDHEILCSESADRFRIAWENFNFWYIRLKYDTSGGSWPIPGPSQN